MEDEPKPIDEVPGRPDSWWYRIYLLVALTTICVIGGLWYLSHYFSSGAAN